MKTVFKSLIMGLLVSTFVLMPLSRAEAQSAPKPAIVVSMGSIKSQLDDANYLVDAAGFGQMAFLIKVQADQFLKGIDRTSPSGMLMYFEEGTPEPKALGFLPIDNMEDVLNTISNNLGEVDEGEDYTTIVTDNEQEILVKQVGKWAYLTDDADLFKNIPENPVELLGDLPSRYNFSAKIFGQRIPESLREQAMDMIREGAEEIDEDAPMGQLQKKNMDMSMAQIEDMINQTESITIGMKADKEKNGLFMNFEMIGLKDSQFAQRCQASANIPGSRFQGFLMDDSAFTASGAYRLHPDDIKVYKTMLDDLKTEGFKEMEEDGEMSDEEISKLKSISGGFIDALKETIDQGLFDHGAVVQLDDKKANMAAGAIIANPAKIEQSIKELVSFAESKMDDKIEVQLNAGSHRGVNMHKFVVKIPSGEEEATQIFGESLNIYVGIGQKTVYLAAGTDPMELLKSAMDKSAETGDKKSDFQYNVFIQPILAFAASIEGEEMMEKMSDTLEEAGKDKVGMSMKIIENGMQMQLEAQDGLLKLIGVAFEQMNGGFGGPGGDDF